MSIHKYLIFQVVLLIFIQGCKEKPDDVGPEEQQVCRISELDNGNGGFVATYDHGKLATVKTYSNNALEETLSFVYDGDTIRSITTNAAGEEILYSKIKIGANGLAEKEIKFTKGSIHYWYDTVSYFFNADNYLIRTLKKTTSTNTSGAFNYSSESSYEYIIQDSNIISETFTSTTEPGKSSTFEYYPDKENKGELDIDLVPSFGLFTIYGKPSKNLCKKQTETGSKTFEYDYVLNEKGLITRQTTHYSDASTSYSFSIDHIYSCE